MILRDVFLIEKGDKDKFQNFELHFVSHHFLSRELQNVGKCMQECGIYEFWTRVDNYQRILYEFLKGNDGAVSFGHKEYQPLPLGSHIQLIFFILLWGHLIAMRVILSELLIFEDNVDRVFLLWVSMKGRIARIVTR